MLSQTRNLKLLLPLALALGACNVVGAKSGGDDSILAALGGMDPADVTLQGITYSLICAPGTGQAGDYPKTVTTTETRNDQVTFPLKPADKPAIAKGDLCHIEVRTADGKAPAGFADAKWKGVKAGQPDVGLLYASDAKAVDASWHLSLTLYKLYSKAAVQPGPPPGPQPLPPPVVTDVTLPWSSTYLVAKVLAKKPQDQAAQTYWVTTLDATGAALAPYVGHSAAGQNHLTVADLAPGTAGLAWFRESFGPGFQQTPFAAASLSAWMSSPDRVTDLSGLTVQSIAAVWVHGFHQVSAAELDAKPAPAWLADVKSSTLEFLVTGTVPYFLSDAKHANNGASWFDLSAFKAQQPGVAPSWTVYALAGSSLAPVTCTRAKTDFVGGLSARTPDPALPTAAAPDAEIGNCVTGTLDLQTVPADSAVTLYSWEWFTVPLQ